MDSFPLDIERRVSLSLAVGRYLRSAERFNNASREFTGACKKLRSDLGLNQRFVAKVESKLYLVTSDGGGNFNVEPITVLN